jgi:hypothetical protein
MSKVRVHIAISADGYIAGPNQRLQNALGEGGDRLHVRPDAGFDAAGPRLSDVLAHGRRPAAAQPGWLPDRRGPKEPLSGSAFNGPTPSGEATADETHFSGCGGFSLLSAQ